MAGPRPHGECVDGASIVGAAVGRPGGKQKTGEVIICSWLTNSPPIFPRTREEKMWLTQCYGFCSTSPGLINPRWDQSPLVLIHRTQGSPSRLGPSD